MEQLKIKQTKKVVNQVADNSKEIAALKAGAIGDDLLFERVTTIIENRKARAGAVANQEVTLMYWEVGKYIGSALLGGERGTYGKQIVVTLSQQLQEKYGSSFEYSNIRRMMQLAARFPEIEIVIPLAQQLSWSKPASPLRHIGLTYRQKFSSNKKSAKFTQKRRNGSNAGKRLYSAERKKKYNTLSNRIKAMVMMTQMNTIEVCRQL